jgi:hypothetical protein
MQALIAFELRLSHGLSRYHPHYHPKHQKLFHLTSILNFMKN